MFNILLMVSFLTTILHKLAIDDRWKNVNYVGHYDIINRPKIILNIIYKISNAK